MPYIPFHFLKIIFISLTLGAQIILYRITAAYSREFGAGRRFTRVYLPAIFIVLNLPLFFIHYNPGLFYDGPARTYIMMPFYAYETLSIAVLFAALFVVVVRAPIRIIRHMRNKTVTGMSAHSESRRTFIKKGTIGLGAFAFAGSLYSIYDRDDFKIDRVPLHLKNLPPQLEGLTISMISDIHSGLYMTEEDMLKYAGVVNELGAEMIFIPGDFVTSTNSEMIPFVKAFAGLKSKYGTYTCLGNHDFFADPDYITGELRRTGMKVLRNETEELDINGARLILSGVDDGRHANFAKVAYEAASLNTTKILLCHKPYLFERAVAGGFDLMLSGHTHGGQIVLVDVLGFKLTPAALASPYISGKYKLGNSLMYVSRGIGTIGLPIRVNCPPEITLFTLRNKT